MTMSVIEDHGWMYYGEVVGGKKHGRGADTGRGVYEGTCYDGEFVDGKWHGRGVLWLGDGARCFDGQWANSLPLRGTAVEPDGMFFLLNFDGATGLYNDRTWREALARAPTSAGRIPGWPPPEDAPGGRAGDAEWSGAAEHSNRTRFDGELRGLRPLAGTEKDAGGGRWRVVYSGELTLAEAPPPLVRQVRTTCAVSAAPLSFFALFTFPQQ
jgi:hypothetical protein